MMQEKGPGHMWHRGTYQASTTLHCRSEQSLLATLPDARRHWQLRETLQVSLLVTWAKWVSKWRGLHRLQLWQWQWRLWTHFRHFLHWLRQRDALSPKEHLQCLRICGRLQIPFRIQVRVSWLVSGNGCETDLCVCVCSSSMGFHVPLYSPHSWSAVVCGVVRLCMRG